jgi:phosphoribosylanthranilate isomerase
VVRPFAVDLSSGVEAAPGVKDAARLKALFAAIAAIEGGAV